MAVQPAVQRTVSDYPQKHLFTVDEYYRMGEIGIFAPDERVELIEGEIYLMELIGTKHAALVTRITKLFFQLFSDSCDIRTQQPIQIDGSSEPEPDISLVKRQNEDYIKHHPQPEDAFLLVEVSDTTLQYDRQTKMPMYAKAKIPEVWIIDVESQKLDKYTQPSGNEYKTEKTYHAKDSITIDAFSEVQIELNDIFPKSE